MLYDVLNPTIIIDDHPQGYHTMEKYGLINRIISWDKNEHLTSFNYYYSLC